ncbi:MAG: four helix bundle suffix domain-containing protein [Kiritimatiellae bacterium]|nr:four helix bundle suffix domain-containing protein [Kiritimatiellia bacterium]
MQSTDAEGVVFANALLIIIGRVLHMQGSLIERHGKELVTEGGFSERMTAARVEEKRRRQEPTETAAPSCPLCGGEMRLRHGKKGDFWGCQACLTCRGTREVQQQTD